MEGRATRMEVVVRARWRVAGAREGVMVAVEMAGVGMGVVGWVVEAMAVVVMEVVGWVVVDSAAVTWVGEQA